MLRKLTVYETTSRLYVVGCDSAEEHYSVLKIDRNTGDTKNKTLLVADAIGHSYTKDQLTDLLLTINQGNSKYYLMLVTKASVVGQIGYHYVHKVEDVVNIYIPSASVLNNAEEQRYVKIFSSVDLTTNFYFSYTYDLSRTLQENACSSTGCESPITNVEAKFVWNQYLQEPLVKAGVSNQWLLNIVHGYIGQTVIELPAAKISLTLIGRRSAAFAGTRFLKRGSNLKGQVANDVETEQILWEVTSSPHFKFGKFSSFVQRRGSVPLFWSQDPATRPPVVMGKPPPISMDINDPFYQAAGCHFRECRNKYGSPLIVVNLVKRREKRPHESVLHDQFLQAISYLNQFLRPEEAILYVSFDVARCNKAGSVLPRLEEIGLNAVTKQGWFQSFPPLYCHTVRPSTSLVGYSPKLSANGRFLLQRGITRMNCVDCLDRTNMAQFVVGKVALGCQLYSLGFLDESELSLHSQTCRAFEELYEEHGDTLALQYAGSQLVHSIKTYKKISVFQERSRDVIQTLSRYYSNTFGDYDKQNAINLFLGVYRPAPKVPPLWDLTTDVYLHNAVGKSNADYCAWMEDSDSDPDMYFDLPECMRPNKDKQLQANQQCKPNVDWTDRYDDYYRTFEFTPFDMLLREQRDRKSVSIDSLNQSVVGSQSFMRLWSKSQQNQQDVSSTHQSKQTHDKKGDGYNSSSDEENVKSDFEIVYSEEFGLPAADHGTNAESQTRAQQGLNLGLKSMNEAYNFQIRPLCAKDARLYENYAKLGCIYSEEDWNFMKGKRLSDLNTEHVDFNKMPPLADYGTDSVFGVKMPVVSDRSLEIYRTAVYVGRKGPLLPKDTDLRMYSKYTMIR